MLDLPSILYIHLKYATEGREDEEEKVHSYWMTSTKREGAVNWTKKHWIAQYGQLALDGPMDLLQDRLLDDDDDAPSATAGLGFRSSIAVS